MNHTDHQAIHVNKMAFLATMHCLLGCSIGEVIGMIIGTAAAWSNATTVFVSVVLAFIFGFSLSAWSLTRAGVRLRKAVPIVFAADSLSIATMEIVDNLVMAVVPGAMSAGLLNPLFWITLPISLGAAFVAAYPVNRFLLLRGKGHALMMQHHVHK